MRVDEDFVKKVAENARLKLTDAEIKEFTPQLKEVLDFFSKIDEVDVKGLRPSMQPVELKNSLREDKVEQSLSQEEALSNAHHKKEGYFKGPRAV